MHPLVGVELLLLFVFINELHNKFASRAIDVVQTYLKANASYGLSVEIHKIEINKAEENPVAHLEAICTKYADSIKNKQPPHVIFDTTKSGKASLAVKSFAVNLGIPTVSASYGQEGDLRPWRDVGEKKLKYLLQVMPPADLIPEVVRSVVIKTNLPTAAILYDDTFIIDYKYKSLLQNFQVHHVFMAVADSSSARADQIQSLLKLNMNNFFILGNVTTINQVLESVQPEFFDPKFAWHVITQDEGEINSGLKNKTVMHIQPVMYQKNSARSSELSDKYSLSGKQLPMVFYFDLALRTLLAVRNMLQSGAWPANMEYIRCGDLQGNNIPVRNIDLRQSFLQVTEPTSYGDFDLVMQPNKPFNGFSYYKFQMNLTVVEVLDGKSVDSNSIGSWTAGLNSRLVVKDNEAMEKFIAKSVYRVFTVVQPPYVMRDETAPKGYKGFCIDLINEISNLLEFEYTIEEDEEGVFGKMDKKGNWNGIVKKLIDNKADISLGAMSVMADRELVIDFTIPYHDLVGITIMTLKKIRYSPVFSFVTVLETNVWICIMAGYFFTSFLLWVLDHWSPYSYRNNRETYTNDDEKREFNFKECLWFCMTSLTPEGGGEVPRNLSGRLVVAMWWLFGFIIIASYTANLAAFLTVTRLEKSAESLEDLTNQYKILYAPVNGSWAMHYFERLADIEQMFYEIWKNMALNDSLSPLERSHLAVWDYPGTEKHTKIWQAIQEAQLPATLDDAVKRVRNSATTTEFAFIGDATDIRYLAMTNCDLQVVGEEFSRKPYAIAVQQGSHLKDLFNNAIMKLLTNRFLENLKMKWWRDNEEIVECDIDGDQFDGISVENIAGIFVVVVVGIVMAAITLLVEYCWCKNPRIIDVPEATTPSGTNVTLAENIILGQTEQEHDKPNAGLRSRFN